MRASSVGSSRPNVVRVAAELASDGVSVMPGFLRLDEVMRLRRVIEGADASGRLRSARIGAGAHAVERGEIRGDRIAWIDEATARGVVRRYVSRLERLRLAINRRTMAGLFEWEGHLAVYPPGAGYAKHRDRFHHDAARVVSTVLYLNPSWQPGDGGELRIWLDDSGHHVVDVPPMAGTLVVFWSAEIDHAVLPTAVDRYSVTGWFRTRS
jgi:SM-20-related protein